MTDSAPEPDPPNDSTITADAWQDYRDAFPYPIGGYPLTDLGNAERFAAHHAAELRFCPEWGKWLAWDGRRWTPDGDQEAMRRAIETVRLLIEEATLLDLDADQLQQEAKDPEATEVFDNIQRMRETAKALRGWAKKSQAEGKLRSMISVASSMKHLVMRVVDMDSNLWLLNVANGTIDLRSGLLRAHDRRDNITKLAPVEYDPLAQLDLWDQFLQDATGGDTELAEFLARAMGWTLTGDISDEKLFLVYGPGGTGKSTFLEAVKKVLGDYSKTADFETFIKRKDSTGAPRTDIARLAGARFVCSIEVDDGKALAEGVIRALTGGDTITARFLYQQEFEFMPQMKLWLACNRAPKVRRDEDANWRRILRIPFEHKPETADKTVKLRLVNRDIAGAAILAWMVAGCRAWQDQGLGTAKSVVESTRQYQQEQDVLLDWLEEKCVRDPWSWLPSASLYSSYVEWCRDYRIKSQLGPKQFTQALKYHTTYKPRAKSRGFLGIRFRTDLDTDLDSGWEEPIPGDDASVDHEVQSTLDEVSSDPEPEPPFNE